MDRQVKATVFIPVYNGEHDHLEETLTALYQQETDFEWEVIVTDSESSDNSIVIIEKFRNQYGNLRLIRLAKKDYSHGGTRQKAAEWANGEIIVYLTQDAVPYNRHWLTEMVAPFAINDKIVAVLGKQKPRRTCFPTMKYDIQAVFQDQGVDEAMTLWTRDNPEQRGQYTEASFYSDVCSAAPRNFLLHHIGYRDVAYSEDYEYGKDIVDAGYIKVYNSKAIVEHSNDVCLSTYRKRIFDETYNVRLNSGHTHPVSLWTVWRNSLRGSLKDAIKIVQDRDYSWKRKLYWLVINPLFHVEKWRGIRLANRVELGRDYAQYSLESTKKK
ncbi:glycosyltransferase family 2 protein [Streptococcus acidominimus]|uniref:Glycosyltransferase n=1 Tax=Streptococcus acidominimus TaxID=1326 RepID=A0A4Y9FRE0_STRAI|nr:glycosyltransferase [Streptococcus acidominimus]MBF0818573.1 glycosyltransferase [Streptococcus acidominimus]MBF0838221.1 glycosyltransferase [Streptococcus acidominimus]MBF0848001.1 glycosyltransferase [Streptococcus danieliae]TFU31073.1 glycosyltransferase [Streptococcus acidominimus]